MSLCQPAVTDLYRQMALWPHHMCESSVVWCHMMCYRSVLWKLQCSINKHVPHPVYTRKKWTQIYNIINTNAIMSTHFPSSLDCFLMTLHESSWQMRDPWDFSHLLWPETIHNNLWPLTFLAVIKRKEFSR